MDNNEVKYFMWFSGSRPSRPFYQSDIDAIGDKPYHTLDELLKISSNSLQKKLKSAKMGTKIKMHSISRNSNMFVKRINEEDIKVLNCINEFNEKYSSLKKRLKELGTLTEYMGSKLICE